MSDISEKYLNDVISNVAAALELKQWSFYQQSFENIAQNYFGVLIPAILMGEFPEKKVRISIVLKLAPTDERYRVSGAVTIFFTREIFVYNKLLYKYQEIQSGFPRSTHYVIPKCYYVCSEYCKEVIVMQNMCEKGYKPYVESMFLDLDHITISLKSLAKLHALSFILEERDGSMFNQAKKYCIPLTAKHNKRFMDILKDRLKKATDKFKETSYLPLLEKLEQNCNKLVEAAFTSARRLCLCHGDIWKDNLLFKYEDNKPISACIIDYQTTRICSPAFDVLYLIITSTTTLLRKDYFNQMLDTYYQTFEQMICQANLNPSIIYSKEMFLHDLELVGPASFTVANTAIWLSSGLQQEGHVRSKIVLNTETEKVEAIKKYTNIVSSIIDDITNYGCFKIVFQ